MSNRRENASFAWDILKSDGKLIAYPFVRIIAGVVLLLSMWTLIFDMSVISTTDAIEHVVKSSEVEPGSADYAQAQKEMSDGLKSIGGHMNFWWLLAFFVLNIFIGIFSTGALTAQAIALAQGQNKSFLYGYSVALIRMPQLLLWGILTALVGTIISMVEQQKFIGFIVGILLGAAWSVLTFFSVTAIMATGCGPFGAIKYSKKTIQDFWKKAIGNEDVNMSAMRRGFYVGGPLLVVQLLASVVAVGLIFTDARSLHHGGHGVTAGAVGALFVVLVISGGIRSAVWAIIKATVYVWAEEGKVAAGVEEETLKHAFVCGAGSAGLHSGA